MDVVEAVAHYGGVKPAARALGVPATTMHSRYTKARAMRAPTMPDPSLPIVDILEQAERRYSTLHALDTAQTWAEVQITDKKPIGILWFGDPHLGDNGCNIKLIRQHAALCAKTDGLYGANIGDTTNNWSMDGRLSKLWAEQDASIHTERRLARWLMLESGVDWLVWLVGNHDGWNSGETILRGMNTSAIFMQNWEAKFKLCFPSGETVKIHAAHNFKGFSDWNPMHGPLKASIKTSDADLYVAGHIHTPGSMQIDLPGPRFPLLLRVASYKRFDVHAKLHGFMDHPLGSAVLTIFNPEANDPSGKITHFFDVELGARVLTMMRKEASKSNGKKRAPAGIRSKSVRDGSGRGSKRAARDVAGKKQGIRGQRASTATRVLNRRSNRATTRPH